MLTTLANIKLNKFKDDEEGFTLIELLVVILIIGILAAVALPTFLNQGKKGADAAAKSDLSAVATKVEACATATNDYQTCLPAANTAGGVGTADDAPTLPALMKVTAKTATSYTLARSTDGKGNSTAFTITSSGGNVGSPATSSTY